MRIVIAEDSVLLREGLAEILARRDHQVVAAVGDAQGLLTSVHALAPDVAIVDVRLPPGYEDEGLQAALKLRRDHPELGILVLSQYVEPTYATELLEVLPRAWATCSRTGLVTSSISSTPWSGSPLEA